MEETTTMSRLEQLEREIEQLQAYVAFIQMHPETHSKTFRAAKHKELGLKIEESEIILEKRRVADAVQQFEQQHPQVFEPCPLCLEDVISVHNLESTSFLACCGKSICKGCSEHDLAVTLRNCPFCRARIPGRGEEGLLEQRTLLLAEQGVAWAQCVAAEYYWAEATEVSSDDSRMDFGQKALLWYRRAAEQGCAQAYRQIAYIYQHDEAFLSVPQAAPQEIIRLLEAAANHGDKAAQELVGLAYFQDKDMEKAMHWCTIGAARGNAVAQLHLGYGFAYGLGGLDKNLERAKYYLESGMAGDVLVEYLGKAQSTLSIVLNELSQKRYGHTRLSFVPGHNCIFEIVLLLRKSIENGHDGAANALQSLGIPPRCMNCEKVQDVIPTPLRRCARCKLVWYCGKACQKEHWKMGHNTECKKYCSGQT